MDFDQLNGFLWWAIGTLEGWLSFAIFAIVYWLGNRSLIGLGFDQRPAHVISIAIGIIVMIYFYMNPDFLFSTYGNIAVIAVGSVIGLVRFIFRSR